MCRRLENRNAIVTGGARGLGWFLAKALFDEGARVAVVDIDERGAVDAALGLDRAEERSLGRKVDVSDKGQVEQFFDEVRARWNRLDILVNAAGGAIGTPHLLEAIEEKDWDLVVDVNLKGTFLCCQTAIPEMAKQGGGVVVNISALAAHWRASLAGVQYTAAKAGVEGLTRQLAYDWGKAGIRVNAVAPTITMTGDRVRSLWGSRSEEERARIIAGIPLRRLAEPEEVAAVVVFLASDESSYITGITIDVSGGRYLR